MDLTIDFETRSPVDLKKHGVFVYAEHPLTDALMLGAKIDGKTTRPWIWPHFRTILLNSGHKLPDNEILEDELFDLIKKADRIIAQNTMFEYVMWNVVCARKYGWPKLPLEKLYDTMAQLAYHALPQNLEKAAIALKLNIKKDMDGYRAMMKLCKPKSYDPIVWNEDPALIAREIPYCTSDCDVEYSIFKTLPQLPEKERQIWLMDQKINLRGIHVDVESAKLWSEAVDSDKADLLTEFKELCRHEVSGPRSYVKLKEWVNKECGLDLESVGKEQTKELLENDGIPAHVRRILEIKTEAGKASAAKLNAMLNRKSKDNRVRGCFAYHGASTGRWAARGIQPQNLPRDSYGPVGHRAAREAFIRHGKEGLKLFWDHPSFVASRSVRGTICAAPGNVLVVSDFNSIESRVLNWLAGEEWVLDVFRRGECVYRHNAAKSLSLSRGVEVRYEDIDPKGKERQDGKTGELACGYQGSVGAVRRFDKMLGVSDQEILDNIVQPWRDTHPNVVAMWKALEAAAKDAIRNPGKVFSYRYFDFVCNRAFLRMRLPSGRCLHYFNPSIKDRFIHKVGKPEDHPKDCECEECGGWGENIFFWGMKTVDGKTTTQWAEIPTYSGKITENGDQGFSRDLMADKMLMLEKEGYPVVLHVHDEPVAELPEKLIKNDTLKVFEQILSEPVPYAKGLPLLAKGGYIGKRYRK